MTFWRPVATVVAALAGFSWFVTVACHASASAPGTALAELDPALAAREVFQDQSYWWKRIEPRTVPLSWAQTILAALWDVIEPILRRLGKIAEMIAKFLAKLFGSLSGSYSGGVSGVWLVIAVFLAWSIWKLGPPVVSWLRGGRPGRVNQEEVPWQPLAEAVDLFAQANQAFRDGMHAEAIRLALLALIARLEKQGLLRYDTTRTNREYQRELRPRAELAACFGQLARIYDRVWYGRITAGPADAEQAIGLCGSVINREELAPE